MLVTAVLAAQYAGTLDLLDTTRLDARASDPPTEVTVSNRPENILLAADLSNAATARLRVADKRWSYTLSYSPSITLPDLELDFDSVPASTIDPTVLQAGTAAIAWQDRFVSVTLSESGSYGILNTALPYQLPVAAIQTAPPAQAPTAGQSPTPGQTPTPTQTPAQTTAPAQAANTGQGNLLQQQALISYGSSNTSLGVGARLGRRTTVSASGGYSLGGGLDPTARRVLPEQFGPSAGASIGYSPSRIDTFSVFAGAQSTVTKGLCALGQAPPGTEFCRTVVPAGQILATLHRQLSPVTSFSLNAGGSVGVVENLDGSTEVAILPAGGATYTERFAGRGLTSLVLSAQVVPVIDILTGLPTTRFQAFATLSGPVKPKVQVSLTAAFLRSLPIPTNDFPITSLSGGIDVRVRMSPRLDVVFGEQMFWQDQVGYGPLATFIGYVGVTARAPTLHF
jgi:hypothetical protein